MARDMTQCYVCMQRKPKEEMVLRKGECEGLCKLCRNVRDKAKRYANRETTPKQDNLYQVNLGILTTLKDGIYLVSRVPMWTTEDFLIFDGDIAVLRTPKQDIVCSFVWSEIAEMLTKRGRQLTNKKATRIPGPGGIGWLTAADILAIHHEKPLPATAVNPLATLDEELDSFF